MDYRLPADTHIGHVHLQVSNLQKAVSFYIELLGFRQANHNGATVSLSASGRAPYHILLTEWPGARPKPPRTSGLYHIAIRLPSRPALARVFQRLVAHKWPFQGFADHLVSEAIYLADPDRNGLELYMDRPREHWQHRNGQIAMATDPLDVESLLAEATEDREPWTGIHPETDIGHVHLHVSDLAQAEAFYHGLLGLEVTQRSYPGALFFSAGGYHHHLGVNVWAGVGAPPPPADAVGLRSFGLRLPAGQAWHSLRERLDGAGLEVEDLPDGADVTGMLVHDPDRNAVEIIV
jgi:catechol 2,3-dioxygenase